MRVKTRTNYNMAKQELGAVWERESKTGQLYLSGKITIEGKHYEIVAFKETDKKHDKMPDWRIYESQPRGPQEAQNAPRLSDNPQT